jgi:hypothetical protein
MQIHYLDKRISGPTRFCNRFECMSLKFIRNADWSQPLNANCLGMICLLPLRCGYYQIIRV